MYDHPYSWDPRIKNQDTIILSRGTPNIEPVYYNPCSPHKHMSKISGMVWEHSSIQTRIHTPKFIMLVTRIHNNGPLCCSGLKGVEIWVQRKLSSREGLHRLHNMNMELKRAL